MNLSPSVDTKTNLSLWTTKPDHCVESVFVRSFFWCEFFPAFGLSMEVYRASPRIYSECGEMRSRPSPSWILFTQLTSEHCFVILVLLYCKLTVISWLNDCEDMKILVPIQLTLFCFINSRVYLSIYLSIYIHIYI